MNVSAKNLREDSDYVEWCSKFEPIMDIVSKETRGAKVIKNIRRKRWWINFLGKLGISWKWLNHSLWEEYEKLSDVFRQLLLHLNGLDDNSLKEVDELMADRCVEGIRKQGKPLWGFYYPSRGLDTPPNELEMVGLDAWTKYEGQTVITENAPKKGGPKKLKKSK